MTTIKLRRGDAQDWVDANPILSDGEMGFERDTRQHKIGDGVTNWLDLEYFRPTPANVRSFGAVGDGVTDDTDAFEAAIEAAIATKARVLAPNGTYLVTRSLDLSSCAGLIGDGMFITFIKSACPAGETALNISGSATSGHGGKLFSDFSLVSSDRIVNRNGFNASHYSGHNVYNNIRIYDFLGFGIKFTAIWDSNVDNLVVEKCGTNTEWAFSVLGGTDTTNHVVFNRLQVELAQDKAMFVETSTLSCVFTDIHTERLERVFSTADNISHDLRGDATTYNNIRFGQASDGSTMKVRLGCSNGSYSTIRASGPVTFIGEINLTSKCKIDGSFLRNFDFVAANIGTWVVSDCTLNDNVTLTDQPRFRVTFQNCTFIQDLLLSGSNTDVSAYNTLFSSGSEILEIAGNPIFRGYGCSLDQPPSVAVTKLHDSTIRNATAQFIRYAGKWWLYSCEIQGTANISNSLVEVRAKDCTFSGNLTSGEGSPKGFLDDCHLTAASPTVSSLWSLGVTAHAALGGVSASTLGAVVGKVRAFDAKGVSLGYLPVYDNIT